MSIKPQYAELALKEGNVIKSQSIVECRIAEKESDIVKVIAINSNAKVIGCEALTGEVRYSGRAIFGLVYLSQDNQIKRSEYGVEFSHKAENGDVTANSKPQIIINIENAELKQLNGSYVLSCVASANINIISEQTYQYLSGGDGLVTRCEDLPIYKNIGAVIGGYEVYDELEGVAVDKVLMHYENVVLTDIQAGVGCLICDGVVNINITYQSQEPDAKVYTASKLSEFRFEIDCDQAMPSMLTEGCAYINGAKITVNVDNAKNKSIIAAEVEVGVNASLFEQVEITAATDVYSVTNNLEICAESVKVNRPYAANTYNENISDSAIVTGESNFSTNLIGITGESLSIMPTRISNGSMTVEGVISAVAISADEEANITSTLIELPFERELPFEQLNAQSSIAIHGLACNVSTKQKSGDSVEMDATIKLYVTASKTEHYTVISQITAGEQIVKKLSAISVFLPEKNEDLWSVAKRLNETPEDILRYNCDIEFPLKGDEKIVFYRQENYEY